MSNISSNDLIYKGYNLPTNCSWNINLENGKREGEAIVIDDLNTIIAKLIFKDDKLNGICVFFEDGMIKEKRTYYNDVAEGWSCEYFEGEENKWFLYENGARKSELIKYDELENYWKEVDIQTNTILSYCQYNENNKRHSKGYLYKDGMINRVVVFDNGEETHLIKEFQDGVMIEYSLDAQRIYRGGFLDSIDDDYPREGKGTEISNGSRVYEGKWHNDVKEGYGVWLKSNCARFGGYWKNNIPDGEGKLFREDGSIEYKGKWVNGKLNLKNDEWLDYFTGEISEMIISIPEVKFVLKNESQWSKLLEVSELVIDANVCNDMKGDLKICKLPNLRSLLVRHRSLMHLNSLTISDNDNLEEIITDDRESEYVKKENTWYAALEKVKTLIIKSRPSLLSFKRPSQIHYLYYRCG